MQKIPTLFIRDETDRGRVINEVTPGCEWVLDGEGVATRKWDGTCCMFKDGYWFRRRNVKAGKKVDHLNWFQAGPHDPVTGERVGWQFIGWGRADRWHLEAILKFKKDPPDGTYELCGPKINGNPEGLDEHVLIPHGRHVFEGIRRDFLGLRLDLDGRDIEGIVWHHPDGRMAKIKLRDFGLSRQSSAKEDDR